MKKKIIRAAAAILVLTVALSFAFSGWVKKKGGRGEQGGPSPQTALFKRRQAQSLYGNKYAQSAADAAYL